MVNAGGLRVCLVSRDEPGMTGTSRYADQLARELPKLGVEIVPLKTRPEGPLGRAFAAGRRTGLDLNAFLAQYPVRLRWPRADVYHLTVQTYASVLMTNPPPGPVVVTVHDIIPWLVRHDRRLNVYRHPIQRWFDWLAMRGLRRADALMADSEWTKRTLLEHLGIRPDRVKVVYLGVDLERFQPRAASKVARDRYGLAATSQPVVYVGSEESRKNLPALVQAFTVVRREFPEAVLVKVGPSFDRGERRRLVKLADALGVSDSVRWLDQVQDDELPDIYGFADVVVLPSRFEGFGLPLLEAMACGRPAVCANAGSLSELAGGGAICCEPSSEALAAAITSVLVDPIRAHEIAVTGLERSQRFTWQATAGEARKVYEDTGAGVGAGVAQATHISPADPGVGRAGHSRWRGGLG